ncbi:RNA polymerase sigma-70 factor (ECF subfamily) [Chitinophaga skermanii]|uniref:RNA polymerase sigma-70 factor (ECF subfamily) n=1 Tax=Chitinophaga skermanii TaxID=331697 RepID=A0A327QMD8_9BACT|nr:RNA polymerase sigma factor [Chitinophaga skermanii]RAJ05198.1 RNA polymerase sigma-70 factor (ECF subfamily) [Chitinophaga skermanii]
MNETGKQATFLQVLQGHKGIIYKIANAYCKNDEDRKDLVQEMIVQLWRSFENYSDQYKYSTWIYRVALNVAISSYRKESKRKTIPIPGEIIQLVDQSSKLELNEHLRLLQQFISELKEVDRALMLLYLDERPYKEISEIMGLSESNVATKMGRIKKILQQKFEQHQTSSYER